MNTPVQLHSKGEFLIEVLSRGIARACLVEELVLVIATASCEKRLKRKQATRGSGIAMATRHGRGAWLDARETFDTLKRLWNALAKKFFSFSLRACPAFVFKDTNDVGLVPQDVR